ncbi:MAG TPA: tyrosine-type recombinase/integrase [Solirubrobacteraceae bacterium]|nr:tyrosine-type recombinase/integrase [Solirubrobacteraceae bacterium]
MTLIARGAKWGVRVREPGGRQRWLGTFDTRQLAQQAEADWTLGPGRRAPTVAHWGRVWLTDYAREAAATRRTYAYAVAQIVAEFGAARLDDIDRPRARRLANSWPRGTSRIARTMWADAIRDGLCDANPWSNLRLETPKGRKDIDALTEPEIQDLSDLARRVHGDYGSEAATIILVLAYVGLRPGELCALRSADLNLPDAELLIRFNLDGSGQEKAPKNGKPRFVTIPPPALEALGHIPLRLDSPYVFHSARGHRLNKGSLSYIWRPLKAAWLEAGGRSLDLYGLRHACATLLLERGVTPADVAVQLGHSDGGRLVQVLYGHPSEDRARERLKLAFGGTSSPRSRGTEARGSAVLSSHEIS